MTTSNRITKKDSLLKRDIKKNITLYLFLVPAVVYVILFNYVPLYGIQLAFKEFSPYLGIWRSPWVGFMHFTDFFNSPVFWPILRNTLSISVYSLIAGFPLPIILALIINYIGLSKLKKFTQTVTYVPYFISTVVMVGIMLIMMDPRTGVINVILKTFELDSINFMAKSELFYHIYVWSGIWQSTGFASIIYIAALTSVSTEIHEAAIVDGASKIQRIIYIDLPSILPTAVILLILSMGQIMSVGFEKIFLLQNATNLENSEIISTYVYRIGIKGARYSYAAAIGLFNNIINLIMLVTVNKIANKTTGSGLW